MPRIRGRRGAPFRRLAGKGWSKRLENEIKNPTVREGFCGHRYGEKIEGFYGYMYKLFWVTVYFCWHRHEEQPIFVISSVWLFKDDLSCMISEKKCKLIWGWFGILPLGGPASCLFLKGAVPILAMFVAVCVTEESHVESWLMMANAICVNYVTGSHGAAGWMVWMKQLAFGFCCFCLQGACIHAAHVRPRLPKGRGDPFWNHVTEGWPDVAYGGVLWCDTARCWDLKCMESSCFWSTSFGPSCRCFIRNGVLTQSRTKWIWAWGTVLSIDQLKASNLPLAAGKVSRRISWQRHRALRALLLGNETPSSHPGGRN